MLSKERSSIFVSSKYLRFVLKYGIEIFDVSTNEYVFTRRYFESYVHQYTLNH